MINEVAVMDPLGKLIYLPPDLFTKQNSAKDIFNDVSTVITKPAILIEVMENEQLQFYYFRSIGWNKTFLIIIHQINDRWEVHQCIRNPAGETLAAVLKKGKQIL
jgi:hypothetical protein